MEIECERIPQGGGGAGVAAQSVKVAGEVAEPAGACDGVGGRGFGEVRPEKLAGFRIAAAGEQKQGEVVSALEKGVLRAGGAEPEHLAEFALGIVQAPEIMQGQGQRLLQVRSGRGIGCREQGPGGFEMGKGFGRLAGLAFDEAEGLEREAELPSLIGVAAFLPCQSPILGEPFEFPLRGDEVVAVQRVLERVRRDRGSAAGETDAEEEDPAEIGRHAGGGGWSSRSQTCGFGLELPPSAIAEQVPRSHFPTQGAGVTSIFKKQDGAVVGIEKVTGTFPSTAAPGVKVPTASVQWVRFSEQRIRQVLPSVKVPEPLL